MDIYELRRKINVYNWGHHPTGVTIFYRIGELFPHICIDQEPLFKELKAIGSIEEECTIEVLNDYELSQWDALNIAIRFELAKAQENDIDNSDIGKAIKNITNGQGDAY